MCMRVCEFVCVCVRVPYTGYPYYPFTTTHTRLIFEELLAGFVVYCCCTTPLHHTPAFHMLHHSHPCVPYAASLTPLRSICCITPLRSICCITLLHHTPASHPCVPYAASLTPLRSICCITPLLSICCITHTPAFHMLHHSHPCFPYADCVAPASQQSFVLVLLL